MNRTLIAVGLLGIFVACDDGSVDPQRDEAVVGFRIMEGATTLATWRPGVVPDTVHLTHGQPRAVTFVWLDASNEPVEPPADAELEITIASAGAATWTPHATDPFRGTFGSGPFPEIETAFRVRLLDKEGEAILTTPNLPLHITP